MPPGERVAVSGFDAGAAEVLVNLVTGASLPDEGEVRVLGQLTADIAGGDEWLASLDRFGIVSPRGVLLEGATIEQNLAMPLTLQIDPVPPEIAVRVAALARRVRDRGARAGTTWLPRVTGETPPHIRARVHLARAVALAPALLVLEHPGADARGGRARGVRGLHCGGGRREHVRDARHHQRRRVCEASGAPGAPAGAGDRCAHADQEGLVSMSAALLREHAARDARSAADAGLGLAGDALVFVAVDDDRGAVGVEDREGPADTVTRVVTALSVPLPSCPTSRFGMSPMWNG